MHTYTHGDQGDIKVDWEPDDKDRILARYSQQHVTQSDREQPAAALQQHRQQRFSAAERRARLHAHLQPDTRERISRGHQLFSGRRQRSEPAARQDAGLIPGQPTQYLPGCLSPAAIGGTLNGPFAFGTSDAPEIFHQTSIPVLRYRHLDARRAQRSLRILVRPVSQQLRSGDHYRRRGRADQF